MRVLLDAGLLADEHGARFHRELLAIFGWGYDGRHAVQIEPRDAALIQPWLDALDTNTRDICQLAIDAGIDVEREESAPRFTVHVADAHDNTGWWRGGDTLLLSPEAAVDLPGRPLRILVENRQNDGAFLRVVARHQYAAKLSKILEKRWAELDSAGGITTNHAEIEAVTRDPRTKARLWALFDSDALAPGKPHLNTRNMKHLCTRRGVIHHMLDRRAIENYLPVPLLHEWRCRGSAEEQRRKRARVEALASLTNEQRYYYNMKKGFDGDSNRADSSDVGELHESIPPHVRDTLRHGIAYDIADLFHERDIQIRERWLVDDKQEDETTKLLNEMFSLV